MSKDSQQKLATNLSIIRSGTCSLKAATGIIRSLEHRIVNSKKTIGKQGVLSDMSKSICQIKYLHDHDIAVISTPAAVNVYSGNTHFKTQRN